MSNRLESSYRKQTRRLLEAHKKGNTATKKAIIANRKEEDKNARSIARKNGGIKSVTTRKDGRQYNYNNGTGYYINY